MISFELLLTSYLIYDVIGVSNDPTMVYDSNDTLLLFLESRKFLSSCIFFYRSAVVIACIAEKRTDECIF